MFLGGIEKQHRTVMGYYYKNYIIKKRFQFCNYTIFEPYFSC